MRPLLSAVLLLAGIVLAAPARADDGTLTSPPVGSPAPEFKLQDQNGAWHSIGDYKGKWVVLYFYPKDGTPGCTKQVCAFRDSIDAVRKAGAEVLGVSLDDVKSHQEFAEKNHVPFTLLSDAKQEAAKTYGVLTSKLGYHYARRDTFLIDPSGTIAKHYEDVDPEQNVKQVIEDLNALKPKTS